MCFIFFFSSEKNKHMARIISCLSFFVFSSENPNMQQVLYHVLLFFRKTQKYIPAAIVVTCVSLYQRYPKIYNAYTQKSAYNLPLIFFRGIQKKNQGHPIGYQTDILCMSICFVIYTNPMTVCYAHCMDDFLLYRTLCGSCIETSITQQQC